jgi:hypothetical protein
VSRDSLFGDRIVWEGTPAIIRCPKGYLLLAVAFALVSVATLLFAIVVARALGLPANRLLFMSAWCASLAILVWRVPLWFRTRLAYAITDMHVIWKAGKMRRSIERSAITFARIRWNSEQSGTGDLILVRAVQTGALRRTLSLTLSDIEAPDRVWATIRGAEASDAMGDGERPLAQRLDAGERVLWTAGPIATPWGFRRALSAVAAVAMVLVAVRLVVRVAPSLSRVRSLLSSGLFVALVLGIIASILVVLLVAAFMGYDAVLRPYALRRATRYFVTDRRVLIRRGHEELSLDRKRIADAIAAPSSRKSQTLFLVLDGPRARSLAVSGAFEDAGSSELLPVFSSLEDVETPHALLVS